MTVETASSKTSWYNLENETQQLFPINRLKENQDSS